MTNFIQSTFLGASIRQFNASIGWTTNPSTLNVSLVEDPANGDAFQPGSVGNPVSFNYQGWKFNGLLQSYRSEGGSGGNPLYEVTVVDPREILEGVQIILSGYNGSLFNVPNIINAFGYWENQVGFGAARVNDSGMPWGLIAQAVQDITMLGSVGPYGGPIKFLFSNYTVNILALPPISADYRVGGDVITLMDFIIDVCEAANSDFFITMDELNIAGNFVIQVNCLSRRNAQSLGQISTFINNVGNVTSKSVGVEFLNNPVGKFVIGGQREDIFLQFNDRGFVDPTDETYEEYSDDTIWPFWGLDPNGNAILGIKDFQTDDHHFYLDSRLINVEGVGPFYHTSVGELRAALDSYESWEFYLSFKDQDVNSPQYQRATKLGITSILDKGITQILDSSQNLDQLKKTAPQRFAALTRRQASIMRHSGTNSHVENIIRLYDYVRSYASEFYGRRFMVRIPFVYTALEDETGLVKLSKEPVDSGFIEEDEWPTAIQNNLLPVNVNFMTTEEGKIIAYVRFDEATQLDLSSISADDYVFNDGFTSVFIKCNVLPGVVYLDSSLQYSPRAIIELPGAVRRISGAGATDFSGNLVEIAKKILDDSIAQGAMPFDKFGYKNLTPQQKIDLQKNVANTWLSNLAGDILNSGKVGIALIPNVAAVPLRSNIDTYGPWYNYGLGGKMEFEKDDSLVPWNYGGFDEMNAVAEAKIDETLAGQLIAEAGTIEFPGVPVVPLGAQLVNGGPNVTDVRVSIGPDGATTTYQMQLSPRFGKFSKQNADRIARIGKQQQRQRRLMREIVSKRPFSDPIFKARENSLLGLAKPHRNTPSSSHFIMAGEIYPVFPAELDVNEYPSGVQLTDASGNPYDVYDITTVIAPHYNVLTQLEQNYEQKAAVGLDALFVPFSTNTAASGIPHFDASPYYNAANQLEGSGLSLYLSPYHVNPNNYSILAGGTEIDENGLSRDGNLYPVVGSGLPNAGQLDIRSMAFRAPLVLAGWGYDMDGQPVPRLEPSGGPWIDDFWRRPDQWKVGPLDVRWDNARKVWSAAGTSTSSNTQFSLTLATANELIEPFSFGSITPFLNIPEGLLDDNGQLSSGIPESGILGHTFLGQPICQGQTLVCMYNGGLDFLIIASTYSPLNVVTNLECEEDSQTISRATIYLPSAYVEEGD